MVKKQPDKFERMVNEAREDGFSGDAWAISVGIAASLLRQYHNEVVELVKNEKCPRTDNVGSMSYNIACDDILTKLKELAQ